ncbi:AMP-dependent synthetase/ligase [Faecalibacter macacae]|uniref:Long-chain fatty acid--CoA ligase n=1 Tax=Faecalibacter macacae TaxID=1859289 RepID=A0A3L9M6I0_9FLAO|nr:long-chain fatty acid--CoA ligase [Faecalibacter macacae]RLZ08760.1 long-chain fatty acid--CoA ligase [Faecalibacter macacae]
MEIKRLFDFPYYQLEKAPREDALVTKVNGEWIKTSTASYIGQANAFSRGLLKLGIKPQDKIAIVTSNNRTEWNVADIGMQQVGAISVPMYPTLSPEDFEYILNNSESKFCVVSDAELFKKISDVKDKVSSLVAIYTFDQVEGAANWKEILDLGSDDSTQHEVESLKNLIKPSDIVTLIYTSGTTGRPKGVVLTHDNIVSNTIRSAERVPVFPPLAKSLSFLPINHVFERMLIYLYQYIGNGIYYAESIETLGENMKEVKPHVMTVVPRLVEKVYDKIYNTGSTAGGLKTKIFMWALSLVEGYDPYANHGSIFKLKHAIASKIVFSKWKEGVGGELCCMVSGSAPLAPRLNHLFWGAGIPILEGYGLTETSPVISVNKMEKGWFGIGTVGKPLTGLDVKIADDGEIMVKGPSVFSGYYKDEEKTKEVFTEDGYFKTGDIGVLENGLLKITDRKKEMFKTSGGKYIAPQVIENKFKESRFIEQVMVVGDGEKMPCAIIKPNFDVAKDFLVSKGINVSVSNEELAKDPLLIKEIQSEIDIYNQGFGHWEQIKKFELVPEEWTVDEGLLTPTLKLKRKFVLAKYQDVYNRLYDKK